MSLVTVIVASPMNATELIAHLDERVQKMKTDKYFTTKDVAEFYSAYPQLRRLALAGLRLSEDVKNAGCTIGQSQQNDQCLNCNAISSFNNAIKD